MKSIFDPSMILLSGDIGAPLSSGGHTVDYEPKPGDSQIGSDGITYYFDGGGWYDIDGNPMP